MHFEQHAGITRTEQTPSVGVDVQPVWTGLGNRHHPLRAHRITGPHHDDLRGGRGVHEEGVGDRIIDGPSRPAGDREVRDALPGAHVDDGDGTRARDDVITRPGSTTSAPATAFSPPIEPTHLWASTSMTSTASLAVWAT